MARTASVKQVDLITRLFHGFAQYKGVGEVETTLSAHVSVLRSVLAGQGSSIGGAEASRTIEAMLNLQRRIDANLVAGAAPTFRPASPAQVSFITDLLAKRVAPADLADLDPAKVSAADASDVITRLKAAPTKAATTGAPASSDGLAHGDVLVTPEGDLILVRESKTGNLYASIAGWPTSPGKIRWEYMRGGMAQARRGTKITAEQAAALGHTTHHCVFCSLELSDERSIAVGYGPVCAANRGLPWG